MQTEFSPTVASLLNRGFVYVIVHVRGGGELGMGSGMKDQDSIKKIHLMTSCWQPVH
jgi:protease II